MAIVTRKTDASLNRCIDTFSGGRVFAFFKETFFDNTDDVEFMVVKETDGSTTYIANPGSPSTDPDWNEHVRIDEEGDFDFGGLMSDLEIEDFNLMVWWTWRLRRRLKRMIDLANDEGWNAQRKRTGSTAVLFMAGIPRATAVSLGNGMATKPQVDAVDYTDLNLTDVPDIWKRLVRAGV